MNITHFKIKIKDKPTNRISKELYLSAKPEGMSGWTEDHYIKQIPKAAYNYDLNMEYFQSLDFDRFSTYLAKQCEKFNFTECFDLNTLKDVPGLYMMVLDEYKQVYIGVAKDIRKRILSHWNGRKSLERLIFGDICSSVLSIDSFGALDTTRIFYIQTCSMYVKEEKIVSDFDKRYLLNRTAGGIGSFETNTDTASSAALAIAANRQIRNLIDFVDPNKLKNVVSEKGFQLYLEKYPALSKR